METKTPTYSALTRRLLDLIKSNGASDMHLATGREPVVRIHRNLIKLVNEPRLDNDQMYGVLVDLVGEERARRVLVRREVDFLFEYPGVFRLRGNAYMRSGKVGVALRVIEKVRSIADLNLPGSLAEFTRKSQGFFLVVGPTGHGKSTTMAALINLINHERAEHVVTIEHPIEYVIEEEQCIIDQREIDFDTESGAEALRASFRQDADVIMIGEMRDPDTIATAVTAAETGHLVFSTLHTNDAAQTINRIVEAFSPEKYMQIRTQLAGSLLGVFSQRLLKRIRGGLIPAYELMIVNDAVANIIRDNRMQELYSVIETSRQQGMISLNHSLLELVRQNEITLEDALRYSNRPESLRRML